MKKSVLLPKSVLGVTKILVTQLTNSTREKYDNNSNCTYNDYSRVENVGGKSIYSASSFVKSHSK